MRSVLPALASILMLAALPVHALPILTTVPCGTMHTCATSILGLDVGGTEYDVTFSLNSYNVVLATNPGVATFVGNQDLAIAAARSISNVLSSTGNSYLITFKTPTGGWGAAYVAEQLYGSTSVGARMALSFQVSALFTTALVTNDARPWAVFTRAVRVPEPGTLSLLTLGLLAAGTGVLRRSSRATR